MKTTAQKQEAERRYSFEEYLKHFTSRKSRRKAGSDDPAEIGRRIAREALQEMNKQGKK